MRDPYRAPTASGDLAIVPRSFVLEAYPLAGCGAASCPALWSAHAYSDPAGWKTTKGAVALANGDLAIGMDTGRVEVFDPETHAPKWLGHAPGDVNNGSAVAATATSIVITNTTGLVAVYPIDGCGAFVCSPQWTATLPNMSSLRPSIGGDVLYVGHLDGTVSALAVGGCGAATCTPLWTASTGSRITGSPVISDGHVVVGSIDGTVTAFALPASAR